MLLLFGCHYYPSDWLERLLWGHLFNSRRLSPQRPGRRVHLCVFFSVQDCVTMCLCLALHNIFHMPMAQYSLFVLKVVLNTNQPIPSGMVKAIVMEIITRQLRAG